MVLFAGPVFQEWYWTPIFFAIVCGPPLAALAFAIDFGVRRWLRPLAVPQRVALAAVVIVGGTGLAIVRFEQRQDRILERKNRLEAQTFDFTPYQAGELPEPFERRYVHPLGGYLRVLVSGYDAGTAEVAAYQQLPDAGVSLANGACALPGLKGSPWGPFDTPCRELRTPGGRSVFFGHTEGGGMAVALLDGTLVRLEQIDMVPDGEVLAYFDSLQPVAVEELEFEA